MTRDMSGCIGTCRLIVLLRITEKVIESAAGFRLSGFQALGFTVWSWGLRFTAEASGFSWVAVKELKLSYHNG